MYRSQTDFDKFVGTSYPLTANQLAAKLAGFLMQEDESIDTYAKIQEAIRKVFALSDTLSEETVDVEEAAEYLAQRFPLRFMADTADLEGVPCACCTHRYVPRPKGETQDVFCPVCED